MSFFSSNLLLLCPINIIEKLTLINLAQVNFYPHTNLPEWCPGPWIKTEVTRAYASLEHVLMNCHLVPVSSQRLGVKAKV